MAECYDLEEQHRLLQERDFDFNRPGHKEQVTGIYNSGKVDWDFENGRIEERIPGRLDFRSVFRSARFWVRFLGRTNFRSAFWSVVIWLARKRRGR
jgi:hypothetical protein